MPIGDAYTVGNIPGTRRALGPRRRHRARHRALGADEPHHLRLRRPHDRRQCARRPGAGPAGRPADGRSAARSPAPAPGSPAIFEVAAIQGQANASLVAGYGFTGILVAFLARHNPLAIIPVAILFGGIAAAGGLIQRRMGMPDATVLVLQGMHLRRAAGRRDASTAASRSSIPTWEDRDGQTALVTVLIAMLGGAIRVSTPFMFVALGECLTEKSGRINLGLEGTLVLGAMVAYAIVVPDRLALARRAGGRRSPASCSAPFHGYICKLPKVNDIAIGIAMMLFGTGLAFFFGKPFIQPQAPHLPCHPARRLDRQSRSSRRRSRSTRCSSSASRSPSFCAWALQEHALGPDRPHGRRQRRRRPRHGRLGRLGALPRHRGRRLPRRRRRRLPVALLSRHLERGAVVRPGPDGGGAGHLRALGSARAASSPRCCSARAGALGPALQSIGITQGYYFFNAAPYILTLIIMIVSPRRKQPLARGAPGELSITK